MGHSSILVSANVLECIRWLLTQKLTLHLKMLRLVTVTGKLKRVSVSKFKGQLLVNFREYYVDKSSGEEKPGSKGITLNRSQWEEFKKVVRHAIIYENPRV